MFTRQTRKVPLTTLHVSSMGVTVGFLSLAYRFGVGFPIGYVYKCIWGCILYTFHFGKTSDYVFEGSLASGSPGVRSFPCSLHSIGS